MIDKRWKPALANNALQFITLTIYGIFFVCACIFICWKWEFVEKANNESHCVIYHSLRFCWTAESLQYEVSNTGRIQYSIMSVWLLASPCNSMRIWFGCHTMFITGHIIKTSHTFIWPNEDIIQILVIYYNNDSPVKT